MNCKSQTLCILPWVSLSIGSLGQVLRCQMSRERMGHLSEKPLAEIYDGDRYLDLRNIMLRGEWDPERDGTRPGCSPCKLREDDGVKSKRLQWSQETLVKDLWTDDTFSRIEGNPIYHLDLAFNNKCNFRCRMCNSGFSTRWLPDELKLRERGFPVVDRIGRDKSSDSVDILGQLKSIMPRLKTLRRLEIVGGEPFLVPEFIKFLEILRDEGIQEGCEFMVTTNGSLITPEYLEKIVGFKRVNINISVDATGPMFEYLRSSGACTWDEFAAIFSMTREFADEQNRLRPDQVWKINLNGAYQTYNMLNLRDFFEWIFVEFGFDRSPPSKASRNRHSFEHRLLYFPEYLSAKHAPQELKAESLKQVDFLEAKYPWLKEITEGRHLADIRSILATSASAPTERLQRQFLSYTSSLDEIRNESGASILKQIGTYYETTQLSGIFA